MGSANGSRRAGACENAVSCASDASALARTRSSASRLDAPEGVEIRSSDARRRDAGRVEGNARRRDADARLALGAHARAGVDARAASVIPREAVRRRDDCSWGRVSEAQKICEREDFLI